MPQITLREKTESGKGLFHLVFDAPDEIIASFKVPGQYVVIQDGDEKSYYALASEPGAPELELLIKNQGHLSELLCAMNPGQSIECSGAQGNGFDLGLANDKDVNLFSMGSGLAPFRALIKAHLNGKTSVGSLTIWQGCFAEENLPFASEFPTWKRSGVDVHLCYDGEDGAKNVAETLVEAKKDLTDTISFWIGSRDFGDSVKKAAIDLGLKEEHYKTNF